MNKTLLAGSNVLLSDIKVEIVDWAANETELSMDNHLYRNFISLREFRTITPMAYDFMYKGEKLPYISEKYKDQALLYVTSYWGNMIIHIDQIKHLTKNNTIETPYRDKYDVKLEVSKDYDNRIIYRLEHKSYNFNYSITDFNIQSVIAKEYQLCKEFEYMVDPLPNEPIVLRNRNKTKDVKILNKRDNETWKSFIYDNCSAGVLCRGVYNSLGEYTNESPRYYNLFLSPKNYQELMAENAGVGLNADNYYCGFMNFLSCDIDKNVYYINNNYDIDVTIHINRNYKE